MTNYSESETATYQRKYRAERAEDIRRRNLWRLYMLTPEVIEEMRVEQDFKCGICGRHEDDLPESTTGRFPKDGRPRVLAPKLQIDHCHNGHGNRKLICQRCNRLVGAGNDQPALFKAIAAYLEEFGCDHS